MKNRYIYLAKIYSAVTLTTLLLTTSIACNKEPGTKVNQNNHGDSGHRNKLAGESSPYLLQHASNPVDWYPWGEEALSKAKAEDKPIFLSIGYSACHWCHVMAHESFENDSIADLMNKYFVSIKVDREQRPDIDEIYMAFTTAMTGRGGWPMSVFLTPELKPFYAGTYFPPEDRYGRPGFPKIITQLGEAYRTRRDEVVGSAEDIFAKHSKSLSSNLPHTELDRKALSKAARQLFSNFDQTYGGFGNRPKFPHATELSLFLRHYKRSGDARYLQAAEKALINMANGGIYDQIGGGFHRYATDQKWLIPHFEKMLYDNALLVPVYADAFLITQNDFYLKVISGTLDYLLREMTDKTGGFYSALDADSEGEEGKFYVWSTKEIKEVLGDKAELFMTYYNVTPDGNFEGHNILNVTSRSERAVSKSDVKDFDRFLRNCKNEMLNARSGRIRPSTDDKILTSWNGLAISAFCRGYQVTHKKKYLKAAIKTASFIRDELFKGNKLTHAYREGVHSQGQFLEDYGFLLRGLIDLYESDNLGNNGRWIEFAEELADNAIVLFTSESGKFYLRPDGQTDLLFRPKEERDGAIPASASFLIGALLKLHRITDKVKYYAAAEKGLKSLSGYIANYPAGYSSALFALDYYFGDKIEIVVVGSGQEFDEMLDIAYSHYLPNSLVAFDNSGKSRLPLFEGRQPDNGEVRAFLCRNSVCLLPASSVEELKSQLADF